MAAEARFSVTGIDVNNLFAKVEQPQTSTHAILTDPANKERQMIILLDLQNFNPDEIGDDGQTLLTLASKLGLVNVIEWLVETKKADLLQGNLQGFNAAWVAYLNGQYKALDLLAMKGRSSLEATVTCTINSKTYPDITITQHAILTDKAAVKELLKRHGQNLVTASAAIPSPQRPKPIAAKTLRGLKPAGVATKAAKLNASLFQGLKPAAALKPKPALLLKKAAAPAPRKEAAPAPPPKAAADTPPPSRPLPVPAAKQADRKSIFTWVPSFFESTSMGLASILAWKGLSSIFTISNLWEAMHSKLAELEISPAGDIGSMPGITISANCASIDACLPIVQEKLGEFVNQPLFYMMAGWIATSATIDALAHYTSLSNTKRKVLSEVLAMITVLTTSYLVQGSLEVDEIATCVLGRYAMELALRKTILPVSSSILSSLQGGMQRAIQVFRRTAPNPNAPKPPPPPPVRRV